MLRHEQYSLGYSAGLMLNVLTTDYQERSVLGSFCELGSLLRNLGTSIIVPALPVAFSGGQEATAKTVFMHLYL